MTTMRKNIILIAAALLAFACAKENTAKPVVFEHKEYSANLQDTKVSIGEFDTETSKVSLDWTVGDVVKIVYPSATCEFTVTSIDKGVATLAGTAPVEETATEAWYPGEYFDGEKVLLPAVQHQDRLPVVLKGAVDGNNIEFASTSETAIICYPLTGELLVKEAYLYLTDKTSLCSGVPSKPLTPNYTLKFPDSIQLNENIQYICFAVPATDKVATLEIKVPAPDGAVVSDYYLIRRKNTALTLSGGKVSKMPTLNFTNNEINLITTPRWAFGDKHAGTEPINTNTGIKNEVTSHEDHVSVRLKDDGKGNYKMDFYIKDALIGATKNKDNTFTGIVFPGNTRYFAIKSNTMYALANPKYGQLAKDPQNLVWDVRIGGTDAATSHMLLEYPCANRASGEIDLGGNIIISYFDLMNEWKTNYCFSTVGYIYNRGTVQITEAFPYKDDSGVSVDPEIDIDIYFAGFFNSIEEIEAYNASLEN